jgi:hypothetical protein
MPLVHRPLARPLSWRTRRSGWRSCASTMPARGCCHFGASLAPWIQELSMDLRAEEIINQPYASVQKALLPTPGKTRTASVNSGQLEPAA